MGIFGKVAKDSTVLPPVLTDATVSTGLLIVGALILTWGAMQIVAIARRRTELQRQLGD